MARCERPRCSGRESRAHVALRVSCTLGVGTTVGAVAGVLLGHQIGSSRGNTAATIAGTGAGAAAGTLAESRMRRQDAQRVAVRMCTGGQLSIVQPAEARLRPNMIVIVLGRGETTRVVPR